MMEMTRRQLVPAACAYMTDLANGIAAKKAACPGISCKAEEKALRQLTNYTDAMSDAADRLEAQVEAAEAMTDALEEAKAYHDHVAARPCRPCVPPPTPQEGICGQDYWPLPSYSTMLFYV